MELLWEVCFWENKKGCGIVNLPSEEIVLKCKIKKSVEIMAKNSVIRKIFTFDEFAKSTKQNILTA